MKQTDKGPNPYVADVQQMAVQNDNFRTTIWTGCYMQMTLMSIPQCGEVGLEIHPETDQLLRVEQGTAVVKMGKCKNQQDLQQNVCAGDCIFVPMGTWHNIINTGKCPLKISSVYAPPHHPKGTINKTKADAD
jgi:mannose-6-phosphate isomerase-like protein (cupin superfamily)